MKKKLFIVLFIVFIVSLYSLAVYEGFTAVKTKQDYTQPKTETESTEKDMAFTWCYGIRKLQLNPDLDVQFLSQIYPTVLKQNKNLKLPSPQEVFEAEPELNTPLLKKRILGKESAMTAIELNGSSIPVPSDYIVKFTESGSARVDYTLYITDSSITESKVYTYIIHYNFSVAENTAPLKPYTITDCVIRCLEQAKTLRGTETPEILFDGVTYGTDGKIVTPYAAGSQAEKYDKIYAPPFTMTKCSLREQLKVIGSFIHAEPRLQNGKIFFDEYTENDFATVNNDPARLLKDEEYIVDENEIDINDYCTALDTHVENVVNSINYTKGQVTEPAKSDYKTLRTDNINTIISSGTGKVKTQLPIYALKEVYCGIFSTDTEGFLILPVDITDYVFERTEYDSVLKSNGGTFPFSKSYALYYTQGQKDIDGLWYKKDNAIHPALEKFAIINILEAVTGRSDIDGIFKNTPYPLIAFQVTYTPIYNSRFVHHKQFKDENENESTIFYNQSENLVETSYYGENVKGAVERLGNETKKRTYVFPSPKYFPQLGSRFDKDFYVSALYAQNYNTYSKCTVVLSKNFNRIGEYIGVKSLKYLYEVNEREAYNREVILREEVIASTSERQASGDLIDYTFLLTVQAQFSSRAAQDDRITYAILQGYSESFSRTGKQVNVPVLSSAFGNVITFQCAMEDNFSAGQQSDKDDEAYWAQNVPYKDYYGRFKWLEFGFYQNADAIKKNRALSLPEFTGKPQSQAVIKTKEGRLLNVDIDSREVLNLNINIEFRTADESLFVGSPLAANNELVSIVDTAESAPKMYFLDKPLNKLVPEISSNYGAEWESALNADITAVRTNNGFKVYPNSIPTVGLSNIVSWAIVTPKKSVSYTVLNQKTGETETYTKTTGGDILIGRNLPENFVFNVANLTTYFAPARA